MGIFIGHKQERQELQSLARINEDKIAVEMVKNRIADLKSNLTTATELTQIYRLQGKILVLEDFLTAVTEARKVLERN